MRIEDYAKKSFLALKNPYGTVCQVYPCILDQVRETEEKCGGAYYTGIKKTNVIPESLMKRLSGHGFLKHTQDAMALGGRAVDMNLVNPLTGRWMTGSSSGTALNVFYGINDLGVGSDGGGSVLAPAAALNLYGFISPLIEEEYRKRFEKESTDGIRFSPSVGFIARELSVLERAVRAALPLTGEPLLLKERETGPKIDKYGPREELLLYLQKEVQGDVLLVSREGPVDVYGMGDTVFGHFDQDTQAVQRSSGKGLMRVANMCGKSALTIPEKGLGRCTVLICESSPEAVLGMLLAARAYGAGESALVRRYFGNYEMYFET